MGNSGSGGITEVAEFRRLNSQSNVEIPEHPQNRRSTDNGFLYAFIAFIIILIPLLGYTLAYSDIRRLALYDQCGNLCGYQNKKYDDISCSGVDMERNKYLKFGSRNWLNLTQEQMLLEPRKCVDNCGPHYDAVGPFCFYVANNSSSNSKHEDADTINVTELLREIGRDLKVVWWRIVLAIIFTIGVTGLMLLVFRHALAAFVWGSISTVLILFTACTIFLWYGYATGSNDKKDAFLIGAIALSIVTILMICMFLFMLKKIGLVIMLLKETTKAVFAMPSLTVVPLVFFLLKAIIWILFFVTSIFFMTSGNLKELRTDFYSYQQNAAMALTEIINLILAIWSTQFIIGVQYMIVAGAISKWFFAKNKNNLDSPVIESTSITMKYHLGTIAFGSMIITIIILIRMLIRALVKNKTVRAILDCLIGMIEEALKFISKNAYIVTAIHGTPFWKSGKRATSLIVQNVVNIVALNYVGDFVLGMAQFLIVVVSLLLACLTFLNADVPHIYVAYIIVGIFAIMLATSVFAVFETSVDSIFICFCEDMLMNDGMARPYAMSKGLMEFVEKSKSVLGEKEIQSNE